MPSFWKYLIAFSFLFFGACQPQRTPVFDVEVADLEEVVVTLEGLKKNKLSVVFFLGPECPLCQNYSVIFNQYQKDYEKNGVGFYGVFAGKEYSPREIKAYLIQYDIKLVPLMDPLFNLTEFVDATTTPEVCVFDHLGNLKYQGAIDNWAIDLGQKRTRITEFYLKDALESLLEGKEVEVSKTEPVGCFIQ